MSNINLYLKKHKILFVASITILIFALIFGMPSLAKLKNRTTLYTTDSWDGTIASSYQKGDGTKENPYIISNGSEFAFFIEQLKTTDYAEKYFELSNDIIINSGTFIYDDINKLKYNINGVDYVIKENTNEYYDENNNQIGNINLLSTINSFKGNLNGNSFSIYGMYISNLNDNDLALFKHLDGTITNIYFKNSLVYGDGNVAGIAINATDASLNNVLYDGTVINKGSSKVLEKQIEDFEMISNVEGTNKILELPNITLDGAIKSIRLIGTYETNNAEAGEIVLINGKQLENKKFEIELGTNTLEEIYITSTSAIDSVSINFSNLMYEIEYYNDVTSGLIVNVKNTTLSNTINKSNIYGNYISSGLVARATENLKIEQSYNTGDIIGNYISSGIIGEIKNNLNTVEISNVYNTGISTNSFVGNVENNEGSLIINNSINTLSNYPINKIINSTVNITNSYSLNGLTVVDGQATGLFTQILSEKLYNKNTYSSLNYNEFINLNDVNTNKQNVWIYEKNLLPILYIDDLNDPIANLNINKYSWDNLGIELNHINIEKSLTFSIDEVSPLKPIKEKYYYITSSKVPLTIEELNDITSWSLYEDNVSINESGYYVIYAKIVDFENNVSYINSDIIAFNITGSQKNISMDEYIWSTFKQDIKKIYTSKDINISIFAHDDLIPISSVEYYISNKILSEEDLNNVSLWAPYTDLIKITEIGEYIIYAKIVDIENNITYINSDYIVYNGYNQNISLGNSSKNYNSNYITSKSSIKFDFDSNFELQFEEGYNHNLISSVLLPIETEMILIDKLSNKIYKKIIDTEKDIYGYDKSCDGINGCSKYATYKFEEFKEIGVPTESYYNESNNYGKKISNEKFTLIINFKNTNIIENYYDVTFFLAIKNSDEDYIYSTLNNTINSINIYSKINDSEVVATHNLINDYNNQILNYNSDSEMNINFTNSINYLNSNNKNIIDTTYENKKVGLVIKLYDENGIEINKKYMDNILFEVNNKEYFSNSKNEIKINLGTTTSEDIIPLKIKTKQNSSDLKSGNYYIKISKFLSDDGYYYDSLSNEQIIIPVIVGEHEFITSNYNFNVDMSNEGVILKRDKDENQVLFNIMYSGMLESPNIQVSLYEKEKLTAYNQNYVLIDMADYTTTKLNKTNENKYDVDILNNQFNLNLITNKFKNTGYKYVFELYDGNKKISTIQKYFIVK